MKNKKPNSTDLALWLKECPFPTKELSFYVDEDLINITLGYPENNYEAVKAEIEADWLIKNNMESVH